MSNRLHTTTDAADLTMVAATTAPFPPTSFAAVLARWLGAGAVPEFDVDITCAGASGALPNLYLYGAIPVAGTIADTTFTATHGTDTFNDAAHGLLTGDGPVRVSSDGALPAELGATTDYWIIRVDADNYMLAASLMDALAGTAVAISDNGTGTHTLADTADTKLIRWCKRGLLESSLSLASLREGYSVRCAHNPRIVAYAIVWTGTATNAVTAKISPVEQS